VLYRQIMSERVAQRVTGQVRHFQPVSVPLDKMLDCPRCGLFGTLGREHKGRGVILPRVKVPGKGVP
jgi:hypothetical protein